MGVWWREPQSPGKNYLQGLQSHLNARWHHYVSSVLQQCIQPWRFSQFHAFMELIADFAEVFLLLDL